MWENVAPMSLRSVVDSEERFQCSGVRLVETPSTVPMSSTDCLGTPHHELGVHLSTPLIKPLDMDIHGMECARRWFRTQPFQERNNLKMLWADGARARTARGWSA